jgi:hypothetical protein
MRSIHTLTIRAGSAGIPTVVDTGHRCTCRQYITVVRDGAGWFSECGGEGNGGCEPWCEGTDPAADTAHAAAVDHVARMFS